MVPDNTDEGKSEAPPPGPVEGKIETAGGSGNMREELSTPDEPARFQAELQAALEQAKVAREKVDAAWADEAERTRQMEAELISLQEKREALHKKFAEEQRTAESKQGTDSGDKQKRETGGALPLERIWTELAGRTDKRPPETESHAKLDLAKAAIEKSKVARPKNGQGVKRTEADWARLQQERDGLQDKLTREQQAAGELKRRCDELENRLKEATTELAHAAEAAKEEAARYGRLEMNLVNLRDERNQIHDRFMEEHRAEAKSARRIKELETRLQESAACLKQAKAELDKHSRAKAA